MGLSQAFLISQQSKLQALLLAMLLPMHTAAAAAAQQEHATHRSPSHPQHHPAGKYLCSSSSHVISPVVSEPSVLKAILQEVQGFVVALAAERKQQGPQAAVQLRQRLGALAAAACSVAQQQQQQQQRQRRQSSGSLSGCFKDSVYLDVLQDGHVQELERREEPDHSLAADATVAAAAASESDEAQDTAGSDNEAPSIQLVFDTLSEVDSSNDNGTRYSTTWGDSDSANDEDAGEDAAGNAAKDAAAAAAAAAGKRFSVPTADEEEEEAAAAAAAAGSSSDSECGSDNSSSTSSSSVGSRAAPHPFLSAIIDVPDVAELFGASNLRGLLLLLQQQLQQESQAGQQQFRSDLEHWTLAADPGQQLPADLLMPVLLLDLDLSVCSDADLLCYWRALVTASKAQLKAELLADDSSSSSEQELWEQWEEYFLQQLLQHHAGYDPAAAAQLIELCVEVQDALITIECGYALACGKEAFKAEFAVMKPDPAAAAGSIELGSSSSSRYAVDPDGMFGLLSSSELLPNGLQFAVTYVAVNDDGLLSSCSASDTSSSSRAPVARMLAEMASEAIAKGGAAASHGIAVLLVRGSLANLPWNAVASSSTAAAAAGLADGTVLRSRLDLQQQQLERLQQSLQQLAALMNQRQRQQQRQQQRSVLQQLLCCALPGAAVAALEELAEDLSDEHEMQLAVLLAVQKALRGTSPAAAAAAAGVHMQCLGRYLLQHCTFCTMTTSWQS
jgi:hypothetical protein